jgi:hypothetical protein
VDYAFADDGGLREWKMDLSPAGSAAVTADQDPFTITVVPEPAAAAMILLAAGWLVRRRPRNG